MSKQFGDTIKALLEQKGMRQCELAEKSGLTDVSISRYISGSREPKAGAMLQIAAAIGVPVGALYGERGAGEWVDTPIGFWVYCKCSNCGKIQERGSRYCPECGVYMGQTVYDPEVEA